MASNFLNVEISHVLCVTSSQYAHGKRISNLYIGSSSKRRIARAQIIKTDQAARIAACAGCAAPHPAGTNACKTRRSVPRSIYDRRNGCSRRFIRLFVDLRRLSVDLASKHDWRGPFTSTADKYDSLSTQFAQ